MVLRQQCLMGCLYRVNINSEGKGSVITFNEEDIYDTWMNTYLQISIKEMKDYLQLTLSDEVLIEKIKTMSDSNFLSLVTFIRIFPKNHPILTKQLRELFD
jgi:hypothetical protein